MRIIAGEWRGRRIDAPEGATTRPTADRVRETLFSMLASRIGSFEGLRVADLFAGSGALGFEALSRGAGLACFVESDARASAAIRANGRALSADERMQVIPGSALSLPKSDPFDLIFADPPYGQKLGEGALFAAHVGGWLVPGALAILEERADVTVEVDPAYKLLESRTFGDTRMDFFRYEPA